MLLFTVAASVTTAGCVDDVVPREINAAMQVDSFDVKKMRRVDELARFVDSRIGVPVLTRLSFPHNGPHSSVTLVLQ